MENKAQQKCQSQDGTVQYSTVQYSTVQYSTVQHRTAIFTIFMGNTSNFWFMFSSVASLYSTFLSSTVRRVRTRFTINKFSYL